MGEISEMMLDGTLCEGCGVFLNDDPPGYPCRCPDCKPKEKRARKAWRGGKRPELTAEDKAFVAHAESCPLCANAGWMFGKCEEGARLYKAIRYDTPEHVHHQGDAQ